MAFRQERSTLDAIRNREFEQTHQREYSFDNRYSLNHKPNPLNESLQKPSQLSRQLQRSSPSYSPAPLNRSNPHFEEQTILIQYELKREKEKTSILEERLNNKQIFINQMKEFQKELTRAFDESQEELSYYKLKVQELADIKSQEYLAQIESLSKKIEILERENAILEQRLRRTTAVTEQDMYNEKRRSTPIKERDSSASKSLQKSFTDSNFHPASRQSGMPSRHSHYQERSHNKPEPIVSVFANLLQCSAQEIVKESKRIAKFVQYFFKMVETCTQQSLPDRLKQKLKFSWKWIKDTIKSTVENHPQIKYEQQSPKNQVDTQKIKQILKVKHVKDIWTEIQTLQFQNKQLSRLAREVAEVLGLPAESSIKHIEKQLRAKFKI